MSAKTQALKTAVQSYAEAKAAAQVENQRILDRIAELTATRKALVTAPLDRADLEAETLRHLEAHRAQAMASPEIIGRLVELRTKSNSFTVEKPDEIAALYSVMAHTHSAQSWADIAMLATDPAFVMASLAPAFAALDYSKSGLPLEARRVRLVELDGELAELNASAAELQATLAPDGT